MIGKQILHYNILRKLGEGGMGVVYLAEDLNLERKVALKLLPHHISAGIEDIERFKIEAKAAASLNHPNITTIHAIEESSDQTFIVMEYIDGVELSEKIRSGPLSHKEVVKSSIQIAEALEAAHKEGIVHRDIKSQNIMITDEGKVKIMDFGVARIAKGSQVTKQGATVGTLGYIPPEQIRGVEADARSDIFSFGVVMYEMLTGHLPFEAEYEAAVFHLILNEQPVLIEKSRADVPVELRNIIMHSLEKKPDDRYQSVSEILKDLYRLQEPGTDNSGSRIPVYTQVRRFHKKPVFAGIAVLLSLLVVYFLFFNEKGSVSSPTEELRSLAVMYFENLPDPQDKHHTAEMLTNLLITSLSQIKGLEVISREQLYKILEDIQLSDSKIITKKTAMKIAQRAGISEILVGTLLQDEPFLSVTIKLIDVNSGHILGSQRLAGFGSEKIFSFVDSLTLLVRNDLKMTGVNSIETKPVADVTTDSPEAYRAYVEGFNASNKLYFREAVAAFAKAIELDSSFAMAYYYLAKSLNDPIESRRLINKAVELANNATERERLLIYAINYELQANYEQASEIYKKIIEKYPHETEAYNRLAIISDISISTLQRGVEVNPSAKILWDNLAINYAMNGNKQEALKSIDKYIRLSPAEPNPYDTKGEIYGLFMQYDSSKIYFKKALEFRKDFWNAAQKLGNYCLLEGKYDEAQKYFDIKGPGLNYPSINVYNGLLNFEIIRLEGILKTISDTWEISCTRTILIHLYYETGQFTRMLQFAKESTLKWKKIYSHDHYGRSLLVWALVKNNKIDEAERIIAGLESEKNGSYPWVRIHGLYASSILSYEEGNYEQALEKFNKTFSNLKPMHEPNLFHAVCLIKTGRIQQAKVELKRLENWPMTDLAYQMYFVPGGMYYGYISNVKAHYWLGITYEKLGEKSKAVGEYKIFLKIWKDADFNSPELSDAKIRLAKLEH